jgi:hypothetical protein
MSSVPEPREMVVLGCPYCLGPIFFTYNDYLKHWASEHEGPSAPSPVSR